MVLSHAIGVRVPAPEPISHLVVKEKSFMEYIRDLIDRFRGRAYHNNMRKLHRIAKRMKRQGQWHGFRHEFTGCNGGTFSQPNTGRLYLAPDILEHYAGIKTNKGITILYSPCLIDEPADATFRFQIARYGHHQSRG